MERVTKIMSIPTAICVAVMTVWGTKIEAFSYFLHLLITAFVSVGILLMIIQSHRRSRNKATAESAVAEYKSKHETP